MVRSFRKFLLFFSFLSGFSALIYEIIWIKEAHLVFGVSSFAVASVFSSFFLGLAFGGYFGGKLVDKFISLKSLFRFYAVIEICIAFFAFLLYFEFSLIIPLLSYFFKFNLGFFTFSFIRFIFALIVLAIPSMFIGMGFPLLLKIYVKDRENIGEGVSLLYAFNVFGGVLGVTLTGFFLIRIYGLFLSMIFALSINLFVSLFSFLLSKKCSSVIVKNTNNVIGNENYSFKVRVFFFLFFLSGFSVLVYEVLWARLLVLYFFGTIYASSALLAILLFGIAVGSCIYKKFFGKKPLIEFAYLQFLISIFVVFGLWLYSKLSILGLDIGFGFSFGNLILFIGFIVFVPGILFGILFPLISSYVLKKSRYIGSSMGKLYFVNNLGAIFGAFFAGFILIPFFGLKNGFLFASFLSLILGFFGLFIDGFKSKKKIVWIFVGLLVIFFGALLIPEKFLFVKPGNIIPYYEHGATGTVGVVRYEMDGKIFSMLFVDNQEVAADTPVMALDSKILAHLPLLLHENPKNALSVGFGSGGTSYSMLRYDLDFVDVVEIENKVVEANEYFDSLNHGVVLDGRINLIIDDARSYLALTDKKYDVISTDVTNLRYKSNSNLYTKEYFELLKSKLSDGGIVSVWVPILGINEEDQKILMNTFREVFPEMSVWYMYNKLTHFFVYIGSEKKLEIDYAIFKERFNNPAVKNDLAEVGVTEYNLLNALFLDAEAVDEYVFGAEIHTDDRPVLAFPDLIESEGSFTYAENMIAIYSRKIDPIKYIINYSDEFLEGFRYEQKYVAKYLISGHSALLKGDERIAALNYAEAIKNSDVLDRVDI